MQTPQTKIDRYSTYLQSNVGTYFILSRYIPISYREFLFIFPNDNTRNTTRFIGSSFQRGANLGGSFTRNKQRSVFTRDVNRVVGTESGFRSIKKFILLMSVTAASLSIMISTWE